MKSLIDIIEGLKVNSKTKITKQEYKYHPFTLVQLQDIINNRIKKEKDNIDFNDIDTSEITNMEGLFAYKRNLTSIDISDWNVSGVKNMEEMFAGCKDLESIGDISGWNIESLKDITGMFYACEKLTNTGDLNKWGSNNISQKLNAFSLANESIIPSWA